PRPPTEAEFKALLDAEAKAQRLRGTPLSDLDNAEVMALRYGRAIIFVPGMGFCIYRDGRYQRDPDARQVRHLAGEHAKIVLGAAMASSKPGQQDAGVRMALRYQSDKA